MVEIKPCPVCDVDVAVCDNAVRLDVPAVLFDDREAQWSIMTLGSMQLAVAGGEPTSNGLGHRLHEHQPPEAR